MYRLYIPSENNSSLLKKLILQFYDNNIYSISKIHIQIDRDKMVLILK